MIRIVKGISGLAASGENNDWQSVAGQLKARIGDSNFRSWISPLRLMSVDEDRVTLAAPSRFVRDWVQSNYLGDLLKLWRAENSRILLVEIVVRAPRRTPLRTGRETPENVTQTLNPPIRRIAEPVVQPAVPRRASDRIDSPLESGYRFDRFVTAPPNELAFAAARRVTDSTEVTFNPLVLYGGVGLGKTHLLQAIAWELRDKHPDRAVGYISAEKFLYRFVKALQSRETAKFKESFRTLDVLLIDDLQYIGGGEATQREFVHTFNELFENGRQIVVATNRPPAELTELDERLRSRLMGGLSIDIQSTTYALRLDVLRKKVARSAVKIPDDVLEFVAEKIASNIRELEGALNRLIAHATLMNSEITADMAQSILRDLLQAHEKRVSIEDIQRSVARHFNIRFAEMQSARRAREVARPRQVAMYLAKQLTARSLPEIGRSFGGRDHTTVMHAIRRIESLQGEDSMLAGDIERIRNNLQS